MVKPGAVVIDVGVNRVDDPSRKQGYRLVGDVKFQEAKQVASAITPVPGGVGPMTITMLLYNTVQAARQWAPPPLPARPQIFYPPPPPRGAGPSGESRGVRARCSRP